jgi:hypothetical protein
MSVSFGCQLDQWSTSLVHLLRREAQRRASVPAAASGAQTDAVSAFEGSAEAFDSTLGRLPNCKSADLYLMYASRSSWFPHSRTEVNVFLT